MAERKFVVHGAWDPDAGVWIATSDDVPGLCCEAANFDALIEIVVALVPELLRANGVEMPPGTDEIPIEMVGERREMVRLVA